MRTQRILQSQKSFKLGALVCHLLYLTEPLQQKQHFSPPAQLLFWVLFWVFFVCFVLLKDIHRLLSTRTLYSLKSPHSNQAYVIKGLGKRSLHMWPYHTPTNRFFLARTKQGWRNKGGFQSEDLFTAIICLLKHHYQRDCSGWAIRPISGLIFKLLEYLLVPFMGLLLSPPQFSFSFKGVAYVLFLMY